jgi:transcriptional regulator GlxA family with amidase domain
VLLRLHGQLQADAPTGPNLEYRQAGRGRTKAPSPPLGRRTGAFILAAAGLLDGRRAATHWHDTGVLSRGDPDITVEPDAIFVRDGTVFTSAGVTAGSRTSPPP